MRRVNKEIGRRLTNRAVSESLRRQSSAKEGTVSVRAKGYGPSRDLVHGVKPRSQVVVETRLHPSDVEVQRSVLALTMPSLGEVSVVNAPDHGKYRPCPVPPPSASSRTSPSGMASTASEAALRVEMLENSLEGQLTTMANLILRQLRESTGAQLAEMEVRQSGEGESLANMIVRCIRNELRHSGAAAPASPAAAAMQPTLNVEELTRNVSHQLASALQEKMGSSTLKMDALEKKVDTYFAHLQISMQQAVTGRSLAMDATAAPLPTPVSEDLRTTVADAVAQAAQVQRESLMTVLEDFVNERQVSNGGGGSGAFDTKQLEEFIEGSLRVATDDIRHSISAEMKKAMKGRGSPALSASVKGESDDVANLEEIAERLDAAAIAAKRTLSTAEAVQESLTEMQEEHRRAAELMVSIKTLLEEQLPAFRHSQQQPADASYAVEGPIRAAVEELKQSITNLSAIMDVNSENLDRQLVGMAQAISDSVMTAVDTRTTEALTAAVTAIETQVRNLSELRTAQPETVVPSTGPVANADHTALPPLPSVADMEAHITAAVEAVLTPKLEEAVSRLQETLTPQPESQVTLAQAISEAVVDAIGARPAVDAATSAAADETGADVAARLDSMRAELVATVEREMGKTHEVNLTPMYQYVDSMLTFLKEELSAQESNMEKKVTEAAAQLSELVTKATESQTQSTAQISKLATSEELERIVHQISTALAEVVSKSVAAAPASAELPAAAAAAAEANQSAVSALAITSLESANAKMSEQLTAIQEALKSLTDQQQVAMKESIASIVDSSESQTKRMTETLSAIQLSLASQAAALETMSPSARAKRASSAAATSARVGELSDLRTRTSERVHAITAIVQRLEGAKNATERASLLQELRREFTALSDLRQKEELQVSSLVTPEALEEHAEAAAAAAPVTRELQKFSVLLKDQMRDATQGQTATREAVLVGISDIASEVKTIAAATGDVPKLIDTRMSDLEKLVSQQQASMMERVVKDISTSTATALRETSNSQVASVVEKVTECNESQLLEKLSANFSRQSEMMKKLVSDSLAQASKTPIAPKDVDTVASETAKRVEQLLAQTAENAREKSVTVELPQRHRVPLWWLLANPLLVCLAVLLCGYYLFACVLVAFVPKPVPTGSAASSTSTSSQAVLSSAPSPLVGDDSTVTPETTGSSSDARADSVPSSSRQKRTNEGSDHFRRVADRVL